MNALSVVFVAFVTSVVTAAGTVYVAERYHVFRSQDQREAVPSLVGLTEGDAKMNLDAVGFKMAVAGREASASAQPGTAIRQSPAAGQLAAAGQVISVTFASEPPKVPEVVGKSVEDATRILEEADYSVRVSESVPSKDVTEGMVAEQSPEAGATLEKKKYVSLKPSSGSPNVEVPKLVGMGIAKAKEAVEGAKLKFTVQWVDLAETASNIVLRQIPNPGEKVAPGAEIKVVVNRGY
jgi:serine/threonine-protein kinase